ncbi:MAG: PAS domain S-box protein [Sterolibacterium sp.]
MSAFQQLQLRLSERSALSGQSPGRQYWLKYGLIFLGIAVLFLTLIAFHIYSSYLTTQASAETNAKNLSLLLQSKLSHEFEDAAQTVTSAAAEIDRDAMHLERVSRYRPQVARWLKTQFRELSASSGIRFFDANGDRLYSSIENESVFSITNRPYFQKLKEDSASPVIFSEASENGQASMFVGKAVRDSNGVFLGIASTLIDLDRLKEYFRQIDLGENGVIALRRLDTGASIARFPDLVKGDSTPLADSPLRQAILKGMPSGAFDITSPLDGIRRMYGYRTIEKFPVFYVSVAIANDDFLADWRKNAARSLFLSLLFLVTLAAVLSRLARTDMQRHSASDLLRASEESLHQVQQVAHLGHFKYHFSTDTWESSGILNEILGIKDDYPHDIEHWLALIDDAFRAEFETYLNAVIKKRLPFDHQYRIVRLSDGQKRWIYNKGIIAFDAQGTPLNLLGTVQDITKLKQAEDDLRLAASVFMNSYDGIMITDQHNVIVRANPAFTRITGYSREEVIGQSPRFLASGRHDSEFYARMWTSLRERDFWQGEIWNRRKDGEIYPEMVSISVVRDNAGRLQSYFGIFSDITEKKQQEEDLINERRRLAEIIEGTGAGTWECNLQTGEVVINDRLAEMLGYSLAELSPTTMDLFTSLMHPDDVSVSRELMVKHFSRIIPYYDCEVRMQHKNGPWLWTRNRGKVTTWSADGKPLLMSGISQDIWAQKATEEMLQDARQQAEVANIAKSRFLATMSHELRTPMNGVLGMAQMLLKPNLKNSERNEYVRIILNSGQTLLSLLNDILDLSKVEAGKMDIESTAMEPWQIIRETQLLFTEAAKKKLLLLEAGWLGATDQRYLGDPYRLRQMLSNLVGNAIKFTRQGHVRIEAREIERDDRNVTLEFAVIDTGIGISKETQPQLFKPFSQTDSSITREFGGTGLGLSIVKRLANLMGGDIGLESEPGKGSRFWFRIRSTLIAQRVERRRTERINIQDINASLMPVKYAGRILVVEDNLDNREVIATQLSEFGLTVISAIDGQQALDIITKNGAIDLILMDLQMPVMDGFTATQRLREWEAENNRARLPIVALTADAFEENRGLCMAAGMDDFLTKPVVIGTLKTVLSRWLSSKPQASGDPAAPDPAGEETDAIRITTIFRELEPLLVHHEYDAVTRFRELQEAVAGTRMADELAEAGRMLEDFRFDAALQLLAPIAANHSGANQAP